jgi:hypothetical protein
VAPYRPPATMTAPSISVAPSRPPSISVSPMPARTAPSSAPRSTPGSDPKRDNTR